MILNNLNINGLAAMALPISSLRNLMRQSLAIIPAIIAKLNDGMFTKGNSEFC